MVEKKIPTGVIIGIGAGVAGAIALGIYTIARAAPPAEGYTCPYCGETFATYEELVTHVQTEHPGERIPLHIIWQ